MVLQYNTIWTIKNIYELHIATVKYIAINSNMNISQFKSI